MPNGKKQKVIYYLEKLKAIHSEVMAFRLLSNIMFSSRVYMFYMYFFLDFLIFFILVHLHFKINMFVNINYIKFNC